jgi:hypothetical protein
LLLLLELLLLELLLVGVLPLRLSGGLRLPCVPGGQPWLLKLLLSLSPGGLVAW